ncbi:MAG: serine hydrolase domain-containing protein, partial [Candidatus Lokiarchaeia archaeon]
MFNKVISNRCHPGLSRILYILALLILTLPLLLSWGCTSDELQGRIHRVENGLLKAVVIKGQPVEMSLADRMEHYKVPAVSIAVINDYKIEWARGYGVVEADGTEPVTPETLFQAASISKPVAAMAALHLVQQGLLDLNEDVNNKLVSWKVPENEFTAEKKVTLRGLLSHSAGVTVRGFRGYAHDEEVPTLLQVLDGEKPANSSPIRVDIAPESQFRYAGGGYCIMQQLLIDLKDKPFPEIMIETVLEPLGMTHSTYAQPLPEELWTDAATGHRSNGKPVKGKWHTYPEMATAGLWTTPSDVARFAIELMLSRAGKSNKVLSQDMTNNMLTPQHDDYGLGIHINGEGQNLYFGYGVGNEGFRCFLVAYPERGQGVTIMTNSDNGHKLYSEILRSIATEYGWSDFLPKEKALARVNPEIYDLYVGEYQLAPEILLTITIENHRLIARVTGLEEVGIEICPESETTFF